MNFEVVWNDSQIVPMRNVHSGRLHGNPNGMPIKAAASALDALLRARRSDGYLYMAVSGREKMLAIKARSITGLAHILFSE